MSQTQQIKPEHPPYCDRCYEWISWDKKKRAELGTKRPLKLDKSAEHNCKRDPNNANIILINEENKKTVEAEAKRIEELKKNPPQGTQTTLGTGAANDQIGVLLAQILSKVQKTEDSFDRYIKETSEIIKKLEANSDANKELMSTYIAYNPVGTALNRLIDELFQRIPAENLGPKPASEMLEQQNES